MNVPDISLNGKIGSVDAEPISRDGVLVPSIGSQYVTNIPFRHLREHVPDLGFKEKFIEFVRIHDFCSTLLTKKSTQRTLFR